MAAIRAIDLFCGAGGSSYGARNAGVEMVGGFDFWEPAIATYKENFNTAETWNADIRELDVKSIKKKLGKIDLILGSPECTNHSNAKGGRDRCELSKKTAFEVVRFAEALQPKWIVIENVIQMQSWSKHSELLEELWRLDYFVKEVELDAKNFGVPQSRKRLFLLCSKSQRTYSLDEASLDKAFAHSIVNWSGQYAMTPLFSSRRAEKTLERAERAIAALGSNTPFLLVYYGSDGAGGWQSLDRPLRTITTLDRFALVTPSSSGHQMRMLQPDELRKGMGYGPDFKFAPGTTRRDKIKLMGNGVCPPVMEAIVKQLVRR
jgi:DNA (cytosine-5)-methyltransferase 1